MAKAVFFCFNSPDLSRIYITEVEIYFQLFKDKCEKTCENFKQLCIGNQQEGERNDPPLTLTFKNSLFHRIVPNGWIQGGGN